jgi:hypothetical protein
MPTRSGVVRAIAATAGDYRLGHWSGAVVARTTVEALQQKGINGDGAGARLRGRVGQSRWDAVRRSCSGATLPSERWCAGTSPEPCSAW